MGRARHLAHPSIHRSIRCTVASAAAATIMAPAASVMTAHVDVDDAWDAPPPPPSKAPPPPSRIRARALGISAVVIANQIRSVRNRHTTAPLLDLHDVVARSSQILDHRHGGDDHGGHDGDDVDDDLISRPAAAGSAGACAREWDVACGVGVVIEKIGDEDAKTAEMDRARVVVTALLRIVRDAPALADVLSLSSVDRTWRAAFLTAPSVPILGAMEAAGHPVSTAFAWACRTRNTPIILQLMLDSASVSSAAGAQHAWVAPLSSPAVTTLVGYLCAAAGGHAEVCGALLARAGGGGGGGSGRRASNEDGGGARSRLLSELGRDLTLAETHGLLQLCLLVVAGACDGGDARPDATHVAACALVAPVTAALSAGATPDADEAHSVRRWVSHVWQAALVSAARSDHALTVAWLLDPAATTHTSPAARRRALYDAARHDSASATRVLLPIVLNDCDHGFHGCDGDGIGEGGGAEGTPPNRAHVLSQTLARSFAGNAEVTRELMEEHVSSGLSDVGARANVTITAIELCGAASHEAKTAWGTPSDPSIARVLLGWHPPTAAAVETSSSERARFMRCAASALRHGMPHPTLDDDVDPRTFVVVALASAPLPALARALADVLLHRHRMHRMHPVHPTHPMLPMEAWMAMANTKHAHVVDVLLDDLRDDVDARHPGYRMNLTRALWNAGMMVAASASCHRTTTAWRATRDRLAVLLAPPPSPPHTRPRRRGDAAVVATTSTAQADAFLLTAVKRGPPGSVEEGVLCPVLRAAWRFSTAGIKAALDVLAERRRIATKGGGCGGCGGGGGGGDDYDGATRALLDVMASHVPVMTSFDPPPVPNIVERARKRPRTHHPMHQDGGGERLALA